MPNSAATSVAGLPLWSHSSTACCLKALLNFFRVFLDSITGAFIQVLSFVVFLYLCTSNRRSPKQLMLESVRTGQSPPTSGHLSTSQPTEDTKRLPRSLS